MYQLVKYLHVFVALASLVLFVLRGVWMLRDSPKLSLRWVKTVPHAVDTLLLGSVAAKTVHLARCPVTLIRK